MDELNDNLPADSGTPPYRLGKTLGTTIYNAGEDQPCVWVPDNKALASRIVELLNHGEQAPMNLNAEMAALARKYGSPHVDYFVGGTWRLWWPELHIHHSVGMHGDLSSQGRTLEEAIVRLKDQVSTRVVRNGGHCRSGVCPEHSDDIY